MSIASSASKTRSGVGPARNSWCTSPTASSGACAGAISSEAWMATSSPCSRSTWAPTRWSSWRGDCSKPLRGRTRSAASPWKAARASASRSATMDTKRRTRCFATRSRRSSRPNPSAARDLSCITPMCCSERRCRKEMRLSTFNDRLRVARAALLSFSLCMLAPEAWAQVSDAQAQSKIAPDLLAAIASSSPPLLPWLKAVNGEPMVKVLVTSNSADASLTDLRSFVLSLSGSVFYNYASLRMVAVMVPASHVMDLARRADVVSVSPNHAVVRASSQLQLTTGAANAVSPNGTRLDGNGVGIAIVDSGIGYSHQSVSTTLLLNLKGPTRVQQALDWVQIGRDVGGAGWVIGTDLSSTISNVLNGTLFTSVLQAAQLPRATRADPYGHGTQ